MNMIDLDKVEKMSEKYKDEFSSSLFSLENEISLKIQLNDRQMLFERKKETECESDEQTLLCSKCALCAIQVQKSFKKISSFHHADDSSVTLKFVSSKNRY